MSAGASDSGRSAVRISSCSAASSAVAFSDDYPANADIRMVQPLGSGIAWRFPDDAPGGSVVVVSVSASGIGCVVPRLCSAGHASRMRPVICTNVAGSGDMGSTTRMGEIVHDDGQEHPSRRIRVSCVATDGGDPIVVEIGVSHECGIGGKRLHGGRRM